MTQEHRFWLTLVTRVVVATAVVNVMVPAMGFWQRVLATAGLVFLSVIGGER